MVAFSGGPDSTILLWALLQEPNLRVCAAHVDHGIDGGSAKRAEHALALAQRLGAQTHPLRLARPFTRGTGQSLEEAARQQRYEALQGLRRRLDATWIATAHHADDLAETVILRALSGTRLRGLRSISPLDGALWRPLLGLRRETIEAAVRELGLDVVRDPTNDELGPLRNRIRHLLLPRLGEESGTPALKHRLGRLARQSARSFDRIDAWLDRQLEIRSGEGAARLDQERWLKLPAALQDAALERLHHRLGRRRPASRNAVAELRRQLRQSLVAEGSARARCDCGGGLRWRTTGRWLELECAPPRQRTEAKDFTYTLQIPGRIRVPEISASILIERSERKPQPIPATGLHATFDLPPKSLTLTIRNRRPGDRAHDHHSRNRRLNRLLAELAFPAPLRAQLPLLCDRQSILWIPGLPVHPEYRAEAGCGAWRATLEPEANAHPLLGISTWAKALQSLSPV
ncbi:MAG: tRNA lysidine(34) synthetase TilS [Acidobacteriota bacterium]